MRKAILIIFLALFNISTIHAQTIVTDRPDFTESSLSIKANKIQIESGVQFTDMNSESQFSLPNILFRLGLGKNFEFRVGFPVWSIVSVNDQSKTYLNDILLEAKYQLTKDDACMPMALLLVSTLPTGTDEVSSGNAQVGLKFAISKSINENVGIGVNVGGVSVESGGEREIQGLYSVSLGIGINDKLSAFVETYAGIPQNSPWMPVVDGGFTYLLSNTAQLDIYGGKGLNDFAPDFIVGGGFSILIEY